MINAILGEKKKMGQTFVEGTRVPVTVVKAGPCVVTHIKSEEKDGYWAVQLGFGERKAKNISKPMQGHLQKSQIFPRFIKEIRLDKEPEFKVGDQIEVSDIFKVGDIVTVTGISKGKGFAGVVRRWSFAGGPKTHGQSDRHRAPGSIGQGTTPGRVYKGKRMAGRKGSDVVTVKNLRVVSLNLEDKELSLSGPVPGSFGGNLIIKKISSGSLKDLITEEVAPQVQQEEVEEGAGKEAEQKPNEPKEENK